MVSVSTACSRGTSQPSQSAKRWTRRRGRSTANASQPAGWEVARTSRPRLLSCAAPRRRTSLGRLSRSTAATPSRWTCSLPAPPPFLTTDETPTAKVVKAVFVAQSVLGILSFDSPHVRRTHTHTHPPGARTSLSSSKPCPPSAHGPPSPRPGKRATHPPPPLEHSLPLSLLSVTTISRMPTLPRHVCSTRTVKGGERTAQGQ